MITLLIALFTVGYFLIAAEHSVKLNKSGVALLLGGSMWSLLAATGSHVREDLVHAGAEIFEIVAFLLLAMSLVEVLAHYRFFDVIRGKLFALGLADRQQFLIIMVLSFFLSAVLDNLTTTIVMVQIARRFFKGPNLLVATAGVVIMANAGGAWSPIGDVTTIMLWIAEKFTAGEIIAQGILPALALAIVSTTLLARRIKPTTKSDEEKEIVLKLERSEKVVIGVVFTSFILPIIANSVFDMPPYIGLLTGLGMVWIAVDIFKRFRPRPTHLEANIDQLIQKADLASIKFFIGILLAVSALHFSGALDTLSHIIFGDMPSISRIVGGSVGLGFMSAILDNVPLAAMAIQILHVTDPSIWVLLALTLGTGGSLLVIGSAAGVVAMGMVKELTFGYYLKVATFPAFAGFVAAVGVWLVQRALF